MYQTFFFFEVLNLIQTKLDLIEVQITSRGGLSHVWSNTRYPGRIIVPPKAMTQEQKSLNCALVFFLSYPAEEA